MSIQFVTVVMHGRKRTPPRIKEEHDRRWRILGLSHIPRRCQCTLHCDTGHLSARRRSFQPLIKLNHRDVNDTYSRTYTSRSRAACWCNCTRFSHTVVRPMTTGPRFGFGRENSSSSAGQRWRQPPRPSRIQRCKQRGLNNEVQRTYRSSSRSWYTDRQPTYL